VCVSYIDGRTLTQQESGYVNTPLLTGSVQRCPKVGIDHRDIGALLEKPFDILKSPLRCCAMQLRGGHGQRIGPRLPSKFLTASGAQG
jgi:hypothetical protein